MKKNLPSRFSHYLTLESALFGLFVLISLPSIAVSFYAQNQMLDRLETPMLSSMTGVITASSGTLMPSPQAQPQGNVKSGNRPTSAGSRFENPAE